LEVSPVHAVPHDLFALLICGKGKSVLPQSSLSLEAKVVCKLESVVASKSWTREVAGAAHENTDILRLRARGAVTWDELRMLRGPSVSLVRIKVERVRLFSGKCDAFIGANQRGELPKL
jgi:hypothetical protein